MLAPVLLDREDLTERNAVVFADACEQIALFKRVQREVNELTELCYEGPNGAMCQHPHLKTLRELQVGMKPLYRQWGLTPHDLAMVDTQKAAAGTVPPDPEDEAFSNL